MKIYTLLLALPALLVLNGCSDMPTKKEGEFREVDQYLRYDQGSVGSMTYFGRFDGWRPVGRDQLFVWDGLSNGYLITVAPPCHNLESTVGIGFTQRVRGSVTSSLDDVVMTGERCRITDIRRIDYKKMREDERKAKE